MYRAPEMIDLYSNNPINEKADIWVSHQYLHVHMYMYYLWEMHEFIGESVAIHVHVFALWMA